MLFIALAARHVLAVLVLPEHKLRRPAVHQLRERIAERRQAIIPHAIGYFADILTGLQHLLHGCNDAAELQILHKRQAHALLKQPQQVARAEAKPPRHGTFAAAQTAPA